MADCTVGDTASHNHTAPRPSSACSCSPPGPILPAPSSISFQCGDNGPRRDVLRGTWGHLLRKAPPRIAAISPRSCLSRARRVCVAWRGGWVAFQGFQLRPDGSQTRDSGRCVLRHRPPAARPPGRKASAAQGAVCSALQRRGPAARTCPPPGVERAAPLLPGDTHGAARSVPRILEAASVQRAPAPRGRRGSAAAPCGRERRPRPRTAP